MLPLCGPGAPFEMRSDLSHFCHSFVSLLRHACAAVFRLFSFFQWAVVSREEPQQGSEKRKPLGKPLRASKVRSSMRTLDSFVFTEPEGAHIRPLKCSPSVF